MLLLIDTSGETASVTISSAGKILGFSENSIARDHSAWLHPAIQRVMTGAGLTLRDIQAVAIMAGPGSYTGLRVGMAAAKGLCFALKIPLITCNNLLVMAASMVALRPMADHRFCPMIDARRQEVFTAVYTRQLEPVIKPGAMILDKTSFETELAEYPIIFAGSGAAKWQILCKSASAEFIPQLNINEAFVKLASASFIHSDWADTVYAEPEYGKDFHTHVEN